MEQNDLNAFNDDPFGSGYPWETDPFSAFTGADDVVEVQEQGSAQVWGIEDEERLTLLLEFWGQSGAATATLVSMAAYLGLSGDLQEARLWLTRARAGSALVQAALNLNDRDTAALDDDQWDAWLQRLQIAHVPGLPLASTGYAPPPASTSTSAAYPPPTTAAPPYTATGSLTVESLLQWCFDSGLATASYTDLAAVIEQHWHLSASEILQWLHTLAAGLGIGVQGGDTTAIWQAIIHAVTTPFVPATTPLPQSTPANAHPPHPDPATPTLAASAQADQDDTLITWCLQRHALFPGFGPLITLLAGYELPITELRIMEALARLADRARLTMDESTTWDQIWHTLATPQPPTAPPPADAAQTNKRLNKPTQQPDPSTAAHQPPEKRRRSSNETRGKREAQKSFHAQLEHALPQRWGEHFSKNTVQVVRRYFRDKGGLLGFTFADKMINSCPPSLRDGLRNAWAEAEGIKPEQLQWTDSGNIPTAAEHSHAAHVDVTYATAVETGSADADFMAAIQEKVAALSSKAELSKGQQGILFAIIAGRTDVRDIAEIAKIKPDSIYAMLPRMCKKLEIPGEGMHDLPRIRKHLRQRLGLT
ncbi:hypothetical protein ACFYPT_35785 [Streptomyces sp. NPDC005529]|uniref:hypothetical protein n=1 Tax=unclassified Streptomyces TaxID=2593676 RepID=UPI0033B98357